MVSVAAINRSATCSISSKDKLLDRSACLNDAIVENSTLQPFSCSFVSKGTNSVSGGSHLCLSLVAMH